MDTETILAVHDLHKSYLNGNRTLPVLKGINLDVKGGEFLSIRGPSGAGKSTFLHLLGGIDFPTRGEVIFEGFNLYTLSEPERARIRNEKIGFVFQFYHLLPEFTAWENVFLPGLIRNGSSLPQPGPSRNRLKERAWQLLEKMGLKERAGHRPGRLSGGEQQRVAIARALINEPDVLLCDEPTGNLDSKTGAEICQLLWQLNQEKNQTLIVVTHEVEIARRANRVIELRDGVLH